jgi:hypothetical protein
MAAASRCCGACLGGVPPCFLPVGLMPALAVFAVSARRPAVGAPLCLGLCHMAFAGFSCMILVMLFVGLFDMSLRVVVDILRTSKAHPLDGSLSSSRWSRCATSGFFSRSPTLVRTVCSLLPCCRVPQASSALLVTSEACASRLFLSNSPIPRR